MTQLSWSPDVKNFLIIFGYDFSNALNVQKLVGGWGGGGAGETFKILKFSFLSLSFFFLLSCFAPVLTFSVFSSNSMAYDPRQNSLFHHLNFNLNFIAEYKILHSFFRFRIIGKRFYTRLLFFKLNSVI